MKRYTFRVGNKQQSGIELHVAAVADDMGQGVRLAQEQLYEQLDSKDRLKVDLDFGLSAYVHVNVKDITEDNLVSVESIGLRPIPAEQLPLDLKEDEPLTRDEMNDFMFIPHRLSLVPLADSVA